MLSELWCATFYSNLQRALLQQKFLFFTMFCRSESRFHFYSFHVMSYKCSFNFCSEHNNKNWFDRERNRLNCASALHKVMIMYVTSKITNFFFVFNLPFYPLKKLWNHKTFLFQFSFYATRFIGFVCVIKKWEEEENERWWYECDWVYRENSQVFFVPWHFTPSNVIADIFLFSPHNF